MDNKVKQFLNDLQSLSSERYETVSAIRNLFSDIKPPLEEGFKYGGIAYSFSGNLIGGIYVYKEHLSIEFSYGAHFLDSHKVLEGGGKGRRHIKIRELKDVKDKFVSFYIQEMMKHLPI
jgi:hypothetical protein